MMQTSSPTVREMLAKLRATSVLSEPPIKSFRVHGWLVTDKITKDAQGQTTLAFKSIRDNSEQSMTEKISDDTLNRDLVEDIRLGKVEANAYVELTILTNSKQVIYCIRVPHKASGHYVTYRLARDHQPSNHIVH